jgi:hypothetical protein
MINLTGSGPNLTPKELIQSVFSSPLIGSTCSQAAEELCLKNNLNFVSLIQPFSKISTEGLLISLNLLGVELTTIYFQHISVTFPVFLCR